MKLRIPLDNPVEDLKGMIEKLEILVTDLGKDHPAILQLGDLDIAKDRLGHLHMLYRIDSRLDSIHLGKVPNSEIQLLKILLEYGLEGAIKEAKTIKSTLFA